MNVELFDTLLEAQVLAEDFRIEYNTAPTLGTRRVDADRVRCAVGYNRSLGLIKPGSGIGGRSAPLALPCRIDGPAAAAQLAGDLLRQRREDITLAICLGERRRLVGTAMIAVGWAQAARLSARPVLAGALACPATSCVLVRFRRWCALSATEPKQSSFDALAAACSRSGLPLADQVIINGSGAFASDQLLR